MLVNNQLCIYGKSALLCQNNGFPYLHFSEKPLCHLACHPLPCYLRDDENWLKTTKATWSPDGPQFSYEEVDTSLIQPRARRYDVDNTKKTDAGQAAKGAK